MRQLDDPGLTSIKSPNVGNARTLYAKFMLQSFSRAPRLLLFCFSISPFVSISLSPNLWAYITILVLSFFCLWAYSVTKRLLDKNIYDPSLKLGNFTAVLIIATAYLIFISIHYAQTYNNFDERGWFLLVILIGHTFLFFSIFYLASFFAKAISTIDSKKAVKFNEYSRYFLLLLVFPIGIWWLYPKIKLTANG